MLRWISTEIQPEENLGMPEFLYFNPFSLFANRFFLSELLNTLGKKFDIGGATERVF
jgi:hypothetical protein